MPDKEELRAGAGFVRYEFLMLDRAAQLWAVRGFAEYSKATKWERRMVTEVFLLHARNLIDFLAPRDGRWDTDVLAGHYTESGASPDTALVETVVAGLTVGKWRARIDKFLSHISYTRAESSRPWPIEALHEELSARLGAFVSTLPPSRRDWFGPELQDAGRRGVSNGQGFQGDPR